MPENVNLAISFLTDLLCISDFVSSFTFFFLLVFYLVFPSLSFCFLISIVQNTPEVYKRDVDMVLKLFQHIDAEMIIIFVLQMLPRPNATTCPLRLRAPPPGCG